MRFVYILKSVIEGEHYYVGLTDNLEKRLSLHNSGNVPHTSKHMPWALKTYLGFEDESQAIAFEKYLKTASGRAFSKKRL